MISSLNTVPPQQVDNMLGFLEIVRAAQNSAVLGKTLEELKAQRKAIDDAQQAALKEQEEAKKHVEAAVAAQAKQARQQSDLDRIRSDLAAEQARLAETRQGLEDDRARFRVEQAEARDEVAKQEAQARIAFAQADDLRREVLMLQAANQAERGDIDRLATELEAREADLNKRLEQLRAIAGA